MTDVLMHPYSADPDWTVTAPLIKSFDPVGLPIHGGEQAAGYMAPTARKLKYKNLRVHNKTPTFGTLGLLLMTADGSTDFVLAIKDKDRSAGEIVKIRLQGLAADSTRFGEIWLVQDWHGTNGVVLFGEVLDAVVLPSFMRAFETLKEFPRDSGQEERGILSHDGQNEETQAIEPRLKTFEKARISTLKHSSGCSGQAQANDAGHAHVILHKGTNEGSYKHELDSHLVQAASAAIERAAKSNKITKDMQAKCIAAFIALQPVLPHALAPPVIKSSFRATGAYDPLTGNINKSVMLAQCKTVQEMEQFEVDEVEKQADAVALRAREGFMISETILDEVGVFQTADELARANSKTKKKKTSLL